MKVRALNSEPARKLTSREISKCIGALLGGFVGWCDIDDIMAGMTFYALHSVDVRKMLENQELIFKSEGILFSKARESYEMDRPEEARGGKQ